MGSNKTFQQKGDRGRGRMLGESEEYRRLRHAVEKAAGDRERAIKKHLPPVRREDARRATRCDPGRSRPKPTTDVSSRLGEDLRREGRVGPASPPGEGDAQRSLVVFGFLDLLTQSVKFLAQRL
jgi:hypothetical protein